MLKGVPGIPSVESLTCMMSSSSDNFASRSVHSTMRVKLKYPNQRIITAHADRSNHPEVHL